jgi:hypothetical protein
MTTRLQNVFGRYLSAGAEEGEEEFGVHIEYEDLYDTFVFFAVIYISGQFACRVLKMPDLVGEIVAGILLGPPLADYVPNPEAFVLLGEVGLVLLVVEAGIDIDVTTLKLIGTRGFMIAIVGSILPIAIGIVVALLLAGTDDIKSVLSAGAVFGPTSLGIALNILRSGSILNTPVGQLIVSAAVIDDMIALIGTYLQYWEWRMECSLCTLQLQGKLLVNAICCHLSCCVSPSPLFPFLSFNNY